MEPDYEIKKIRESSTRRERWLLLAVVAVAIGLGAALNIERRARQEDVARASLEASRARAYAADQLDKMGAEQIRHKEYLEHQIDALADKVHELEKRCGGDKGGR